MKLTPGCGTRMEYGLIQFIIVEYMKWTWLAALIELIVYYC
jgi:hypothetical protein